MFQQTISTGNNITYLKNTGNMTHLQPENQVKVKTIKARLIKTVCFGFTVIDIYFDGAIKKVSYYLFS